MLSDAERKILRILINFTSLRGRSPTIKELMSKTGRTWKGVLQVLAVLERAGYIEWNRRQPDRIVVLRRPEEDYLGVDGGLMERNRPFWG